MAIGMLVALEGEAVCFGRIKLGQISKSRDEDLHHFRIARTDENQGAVCDCWFITQ